MHCLLVIAHPLPTSLTHALAAHAHHALQAAGHHVQTLDLYAQGFDPALAASERTSYYAPVHHPTVAADSWRRCKKLRRWWRAFRPGGSDRRPCSRAGSTASGRPAWRTTTRPTWAPFARG